jgi:hypothetical protein
MPTIKRRRREQRTGFGRSLSDAQHDFLLHGFSLFQKSRLQRTSFPMVPSTSPFTSESNARTAWQRHRAELLAEHHPGERPSAFFEFDLRIPTPSTWWEQLRTLLDHDLMPAEEQIAVESMHDVLDPLQSPGFNSAFESEAGTCAANLGSAVLHQLAQEFTFASEWHQRRGRAAVAERYGLRSSCLRAVIISEVGIDDHKT